MQSSVKSLGLKIRSIGKNQTSQPAGAVTPERASPNNAVNDGTVMLSHGFCLAHKLGSGSYSKVRMAVHKTTRKRVAVKIIDRRRAPRDYQDHFLPRELAVIRQLQHPNVLRTYEWFEQNQKVYMVLELAESGDVLEYIRTVTKGAVPEVLARKWSLQTGRALLYMHGMDVVHRDVKCENLLLDRCNNIKLTDFGFVRSVGKGSLSKTFCGSAAYAAPEIIRSVPYCPLKSDVWALGVVIYILVVGCMPFGDDVKNIKKILHQQYSGAHFDASKNTAVRDECRDLIRSMLTISPKARLTLGEVMESEWLNQVQIS
ncbi:testis-specific serine/threonine-protein kinase 1-like [Strongylocentrotus purpuratus]|uniref:Protein kinase domain-containing protein n=1 Tax=Strongylocentrotus purpuratus TaxID=7668 RepID=A0A7M7RC89_STRPU|nr:testis-specific serine/threonine-protein kinase 1-like [Strongylocentrotus purpuratus]|eukprot:XP_787865.3 PREDICTED: testis-specific serine/threonine-protein kinase 1-like [Strongylocentrotus purpuratus]